MNPPTDATDIPEAAISALSARMAAILGDRASGDDVADFNRLLDMAARSAALEAEIAALKSEAQNPYVLRIPENGPRYWAKECRHERTYTAEATICRRCNKVV